MTQRFPSIFMVLYTHALIARLDINFVKTQRSLRKTLTTSSDVTDSSFDFVESKSLDLHVEQECLSNLTSYAYSSYLCGAPDLETFTELHKAEYTCADRCSHAPTLEKIRECGCDEMCLVYGDCCADFLDQCPEVDSRGRILYAHLLRVSVICADSFALVYSVSGTLFSSSTVTVPSNSPTVPSASSAPTTNPHSYSWKKMKFLLTLPHFKVIDVPFGVVFYNYETFNRLKTSSSKPYFIPRVAAFDCSGHTASVNYKKIAPIIEQCRLIEVRDAKVSSQRNCYNEDINIVKCQCRGLPGSIKVNLHKACLGDHGYMPLHNMATVATPAYGVDNEYNNLTEGKCVYENVLINPFAQGVEKFHPETSVELVFSPIFPTVDHTDKLRLMNNTQSSTSAHHGDDADSATDIPSIEYVVELSKTLERYVRCPISYKVLSDCQLERCAKGAFLWTNPPPQVERDFQNRKSFFPVLATIEAVGHSHGVPLCTCLGVLRAMVATQMWSVKMKHTGHTECHFWLQAVPEERYQETGEPVFDRNFTTHEVPTTTDAMVEKLQNHLNTKYLSCPADNIYELQICLHEREKDLALKSTDDVMCMSYFVGQQKRIISLNNFGLKYSPLTKMFLTLTIAWGLKYSTVTKMF